MRLYVEDFRSRGICSPGIRRFAHKYGIDLRDFLENGIDEEKLLATGDAQALHLLQEIKAKAVDQHGREQQASNWI